MRFETAYQLKQTPRKREQAKTELKQQIIAFIKKQGHTTTDEVVWHFQNECWGTMDSLLSKMPELDYVKGVWSVKQT